jgi:hypothetical protein
MNIEKISCERSPSERTTVATTICTAPRAFSPAPYASAVQWCCPTSRAPTQAPAQAVEATRLDRLGREGDVAVTLLSVAAVRGITPPRPLPPNGACSGVPGGGGSARGRTGSGSRQEWRGRSVCGDGRLSRGATPSPARCARRRSAEAPRREGAAPHRAGPDRRRRKPRPEHPEAAERRCVPAPRRRPPRTATPRARGRRARRPPSAARDRPLRRAPRGRGHGGVGRVAAGGGSGRLSERQAIELRVGESADGVARSSAVLAPGARLAHARFEAKRTEGGSFSGGPFPG